jgi:hypothetical protein
VSENWTSFEAYQNDCIIAPFPQWVRGGGQLLPTATVLLKMCLCLLKFTICRLGLFFSFESKKEKVKVKVKGKFQAIFQCKF